MSERYRYKLTLEVTDHGERSFAASSEADDQGALAESLAYDIGRMFVVLNDPPSTDAVVLAMDERGDDPLAVLAYLRSRWTGEHVLPECVRLVVDFDRLLEGEPPDRIEAVRSAATTHAFVTAAPGRGERP